MPKVKNYKPLRKVTTMLLVMAAFSFGTLCLAQAGIAHADSDSSAINVNVSDGITIRVLDSTATTDLEELAFDFVPTDTGVSATKNAVVEVATSNETGYKLYVQSDWREDNTSSTGAHKDNPDGTGTDSTAPHTTSLIHSGATSIPAVTDKIPTKLPSALSSTTPASASDYPFWYYYNDFYSANRVIPAYGNPDKLAELGEATDGDYTTVPITVGVDTSIVAGTYRNKLVFTAIANELPVDYKLSFDSNGGSGIEATQEAYKVQTSYTFTIPTNKQSEGVYNVEYGTKALLGWSEDKNATTPDYVAGDSITLIADNPKLSDKQTVEKTLYAVWRDAPEFYNIANMQDMTTAICSTLYTPSNATGDDVTLISDPRDYKMLGDNTPNVPQGSLYDIRDGNLYVVRKLADGRCWMAENLRYTPKATYTDSYGSYYPHANSLSVCQISGWRQPNNSIFSSLLTKYSTNESLLSVPYSATFNGFYHSYYNEIRGLNELSFHYSSDKINDNDAYFLSIGIYVVNSPRVVNTGRLEDRMNVRCVAI